MKTFVFRNATLEPFFQGEEVEFSGYGDVSNVPKDAENFLWFYTFPPETSSEEAIPQVNDFLARLHLIIARAPEEVPFRAVLLAPPSARTRIVSEDTNFETAVEFFNSALRELERSKENFSCVSVPAEILNDIDWRFYFIAQIPFSPKHTDTLAKILREQSLPKTKQDATLPATIPAARKKCLVLDLDDTLWGGVVGEEGVGGIAVSGEYPGNAFSLFQKRISELAGSGIVLALSSKNNMADVEEAFTKRSEMPLKLEDFSVKKIDWRDKATHIREIVEELNIGMDSVVLVDNSEAERAWVRAALPEVAVPEFPKNAFELPEFFAKLLDEYFRTKTLTKEDAKKTEMYRANAKRKEFARNCASHKDYLAELGMELTIFVNDPATFPRLVQLSQKTNQFNLANRRFTLADIEVGSRLYALAVKDVFGDNGICGAAVVAENANEETEIKEFLLSCRVLGRGIEDVFLGEILRLEGEHGVEKITAEFVPTQKNVPAKDFYSKNGFSEISPNKFSLELRSRKVKPPSTIYKISCYE